MSTNGHMYTPPDSQLHSSLLPIGRSLRYCQKSPLEPKAWLSVIEEDYRLFLEAVDWGAVFPYRQSPYSLLDIGCGLGRCPTLLRSHLPEDIIIHYDMCDSSQYCLTTCRQTLRPPLFPRNAWQLTLEHAPKTWPSSAYDMAWAIHSLHTLNHENLYDSLQTMIKAIHPSRGTACILLAKRGAFISQIHQQFSQQFSFTPPPPYVSAEAVATILERLGTITVIRELECIHTISIWEDRLLEQYLQHGTMDATPLPRWKEISRLRTFLDAFRHGDYYYFPNPCWLMLMVPQSAGPEGRHRLHRYLKAITSSRLAS